MIPFWPARPIRVASNTPLFERLIADPAYAVEPKLNGWRVVVVWAPEGVRAWTRHGKPQVLRPVVLRVLEAACVPAGTAVDGELLGPRGGEHCFVAFDLPMYAGALDRVSDLDVRRARLEALGLPVIDRYTNSKLSYTRALAARHEGLVLKTRAAPYPFGLGPDAETALWLKVKAPTLNGLLV